VPRTKLVTAGIAAVFTAAILFADSRAESIRFLLALEKRSLAVETRRIADLAKRVEATVADVTAASAAAGEAAQGTEEELRTAAEALARATAEVDAAIFDQRVCADRIVQMRQRIADLEKEVSSSQRPHREDHLSGDWKVRIDPGEQEGQFHFSLEGTIVSGSYTLEGGFAGSLRGTLVEDRVKVERIDDRLGLNAVYYGRLARDGGSIAGTWEATDVASGPSAGQWTAVRLPPPEESQP
jgi:hypothetical protein